MESVALQVTVTLHCLVSDTTGGNDSLELDFSCLIRHFKSSIDKPTKLKIAKEERAENAAYPSLMPLASWFGSKPLRSFFGRICFIFSKLALAEVKSSKLFTSKFRNHQINLCKMSLKDGFDEESGLYARMAGRRLSHPILIEFSLFLILLHELNLNVVMKTDSKKFNMVTIDAGFAWIVPKLSKQVLMENVQVSKISHQFLQLFASISAVWNVFERAQTEDEWDLVLGEWILLPAGIHDLSSSDVQWQFGLTFLNSVPATRKRQTT